MLAEREPGSADDTARHDVPAIHVHMHSEHELEAEAPKTAKHWLTVAIGAAVTAILAWLANRLGKH